MKHLAQSFPVADSHIVPPQIPQHSLQELDEGLEDNRSQHVILCFDLSCQAMLGIVNCISVNTL